MEDILVKGPWKATTGHPKRKMKILHKTSKMPSSVLKFIKNSVGSLEKMWILQ